MSESIEPGPGSSRCRSCGTFVSQRFAQVFGNNEDEVYGCIECSTLRDLQEGAATRQ